MVAPKNPSGATKEKSEDKKSVPSSPEPFQEPEGMTTVDLNKSDDYIKESCLTETAKLKQRAQIKYVAQLLFALGSILFVVLVIITLAFLNKEYHIFTVLPRKIDELYPHHPHHMLTPTEEFVNLTKILNQALFRDKLKSGNYLEDSYGEMNYCRLKQTVDACCEIFKNTDLHSLAEYCTVNDMLNILLEFERERRKKRQVNGDPYIDHENDYLGPYADHYDTFQQYPEQEYHNVDLQAPYYENPIDFHQEGLPFDYVDQPGQHYEDIFQDQIPNYFRGPELGIPEGIGTPQINPTDFNQNTFPFNDNYQQGYDNIGPEPGIRYTSNPRGFAEEGVPLEHHVDLHVPFFVQPNTNLISHDPNLVKIPKNHFLGPNFQDTKHQISFGDPNVPILEHQYKPQLKQNADEHNPNEHNYFQIPIPMPPREEVVENFHNERSGQKFEQHQPRIQNIDTYSNNDKDAKVHNIKVNADGKFNIPENGHEQNRFEKTFKGHEVRQRPNSVLFGVDSGETESIPKKHTMKVDPRESGNNRKNQYDHTFDAGPIANVKDHIKASTDIIPEKINIEVPYLKENKPKNEPNNNDINIGDALKKSLLSRFENDVKITNNTKELFDSSKMSPTLKDIEVPAGIVIPPNAKIIKEEDYTEETTKELPQAIDQNSTASEEKIVGSQIGNSVKIRYNNSSHSDESTDLDSNENSSQSKEQPNPIVPRIENDLNMTTTTIENSTKKSKVPILENSFTTNSNVRDQLDGNSTTTDSVKSQLDSLHISVPSGKIKELPQTNISLDAGIMNNKTNVDETITVLPILTATYSEAENEVSTKHENSDSSSGSASSIIQKEDLNTQLKPNENALQSKDEQKLNVSRIENDLDMTTSTVETDISVPSGKIKGLPQTNISSEADIMKNKTNLDETITVLPILTTTYSEAENEVSSKYENNDGTSESVYSNMQKEDLNPQLKPNNASQSNDQQKLNASKIENDLDMTTTMVENFTTQSTMEPILENSTSIDSNVKGELDSLNITDLSLENKVTPQTKTLSNPEDIKNKDDLDDTTTVFPRIPSSNSAIENKVSSEPENYKNYNGSLSASSDKQKEDFSALRELFEDAINVENNNNYLENKASSDVKDNKSKDDLEPTSVVFPVMNIDNNDTALPATNINLEKHTSENGNIVLLPKMASTQNTNSYSSDSTRANSNQDDFSAKSKQLEEYLQSNQQASTFNPCFYPYMNPYMPYMPTPAKSSAQDSGFLKVITVSQPRVQNQPMYVLNPSMYYGIPPSPQPAYPNFPPNPYMPPSYYPPMAQTFQSPVGATHNTAPVQVAAPGGQYYMCNPIPTPTNNVAGMPGVEVRREASNLQTLMEGFQQDDFTRNNRSREAGLICPLGEQACLDSSACIKNHHICDNEVHCDDSSDEIACSCKERVGKLRLCDGYCDCPRCEDEQGCFGCDDNEFSCDDWSRFRRSTCIPLVQKCDGIKQCEITGKDEMDCSILADHIGNFPLNKISNSVGFLHRNYKGKWYPTCFGTELWAAQVCQVEAGPSAIIPKAHMTLTTDPYNGLFINILPNNDVSLVNTCVQDRAAFIQCPPIYCGLRFLVNNPYRAQEVDTSVEDMLNDLERAYKMRQNNHKTSESDSETYLGQQRYDLDNEELEDLVDGDRQSRSVSIENETLVDENDDVIKKEDSFDLRTKGNLTHEHLEEVIENLERTFRRRDVSDQDRFSATLKETRVVGGKPSQPAAWPWLVSIYKNGIFHCGGVLINELWIVTASHCVDRYWQYYYEIQAGALRRFSYTPMDQRRWAKVVVGHESYSNRNLRNDIALMKLSAPIRYNRYVRPICLPSESTAGQDFLKGPSAGTICTTVGWGATIEHGADPDHLREVEVPILQHCKHQEDSDVDEICAGLSEGGKDACQGDSGGPLMCRNPNNPNQWYLAGIVSHGEGCARPNEPGVYTKVSRYMGWIAESTRHDKFTLTNPLLKCPGYICKGTKRCIAKKRRCDRIVDCLLGDDELNCENRFKDIFKHARKSAVPTHISQPSGNVVEEIVENLMPMPDFGLLGSNQNSSTKDIDGNATSDEDSNEYIEENATLRKTEDTEKAKGFEEIYFKCKIMLQVIPIEKRCNKILDCEDGSDETRCSCADYIRTEDDKAICDGVTDCIDLSDESDCVKCNTTEYTCRISQKCIDITKRCDGTSDCPQNEDEMNCVSLTNGHNLTLDKDNRPMFKSRGIVTINLQGQWRSLCLNKTSPFVDDEPSLSTVVCNLLGFGEYVSYHKYRTEDKIINSTYSISSGKILLDPEPKTCDNCCDGLYVSCSNTSISSTLQYKSLEQVKELYFAPWMATIYFNGRYECMGTLLNEFWIVTSAKCFKGNTLLQLNYVAAVLGKGKLHLTVKGPHEQVIRISSSVNVEDTDIVLLRLEEDVKFNRYVQAADLNARREGNQKEKCYAVGQDNGNRTMFVPLLPLKNCLVGFRCFEKKIEENCKDRRGWSGTIICDSRAGWYPAAIFSEEEGHCGFSHLKQYTSVKFYKNHLFNIMALVPKPTPPPLCIGFQCPMGNCIPEEKICDDITDCYGGEDEQSTLCYEKEKDCNLRDNCVCAATDLKCPAINKCYPKSAYCDRTNNCGEFEDEPDVCSCRNYLKLTNPGKICDSILNCMDRTDEDPEICSCKLDDFQCGKLNQCIPQDMVCDGVQDCPNGEDEATCLTLKTDDGHKGTNAGEVMTKTAGIWHSGCFDLNYSTTELEDICTKLGFSGSSASQLTPPHNLSTVSTLRPVLDPFDVVWLRRSPGNKLRMRLRSGHDPYVKFVTDKKCHRLFVACVT